MRIANASFKDHAGVTEKRRREKQTKEKAVTAAPSVQFSAVDDGAVSLGECDLFSVAFQLARALKNDMQLGVLVPVLPKSVACVFVF